MAANSIKNFVSDQIKQVAVYKLSCLTSKIGKMSVDDSSKLFDCKKFLLINVIIKFNLTISFFVLATLLSWSDAQQSAQLNSKQQQLLNAVIQQQHNNNMQPSNNQARQMNPLPMASVRSEYNLTSISARPIERPSLNLVAREISHSGTKNLTSTTQQLDMMTLDATKFILGNQDLMFEEGKNLASFAEAKNSTSSKKGKRNKNNSAGMKSAASNRSSLYDDEQSADSSDSNDIFDDVDEASGIAGNLKEPECAANGRFYCTYKEDYPLKLVTEVTKYYKWPLEKLFRDLHAQIMPKLAQDSTGNLVCDSITRVVRPGWARNTNERWLVVINNDNYHQYVTEVVCQYGSNSRCNFIPPCYYSSCQQRYNTQKLLVIDPSNPYRGPFMSEFLFPSCCVCYVPSVSDSYQDKFRSAPATICQRTLQQESANNLYPPQFRPPGLLEDVQSSLVDSSIAASSSLAAGSKSSKQQYSSNNQASGPGEIRREGFHYNKNQEAHQQGSGEPNSAFV